MRVNPNSLLAVLVGFTLNLGLSGVAEAALQGRDLNGSISSAEAYYDTDLNITWLADANYAQTVGYDADGKMTWANANTWADQLDINGYGNWRLPTNLQTDASCGTQSSAGSYGFNCTGGEMGHLFYSELGGVAGQSILTSADSDVAKFTNLTFYGFWGSEHALNTDIAFHFTFGNGYQTWDWKFNSLNAFVVSPGDVGVPVVAIPEAQTYAMMLAGLGLVGFVARCRKQIEA